MRKQITDSLLLVRPAAFRKNEQTAVNNYFQRSLLTLDDSQINYFAQKEFDQFAENLRSHGIRVTVVQDKGITDSPDSIFPNHIISLHQDGKIILYPMFAQNRRRERLLDFESVLKENGYKVNEVKDISKSESQHRYLEGSGALILDRGASRLAYCALSERANPDLLDEFCRTENYTPVMFHAYQTIGDQRVSIYHTTIVLALGEDFAIVCPDAIDDEAERHNLLRHLKDSGKEIIEISENQLNHFAANCLQVLNRHGNRFIVLSEEALKSLTLYQIAQLEKHGKIIATDLSVIETCGGGSAKSMIAEIFLPKESGA